MKHFVKAVIFLLVLNQARANTYVYEFGQDVGRVIYQHEGTVPLFSYVTEKNIPVPQGVSVTYVKVTVNSLSPPKVDFHSQTNRVSIKYSLTQLSFSSYSILVKGETSYNFDMKLV